MLIGGKDYTFIQAELKRPANNYNFLQSQANI